MVVQGLDDYIRVKCDSALKEGTIYSTDSKPHFIVDGVSFTSYIIRKTSWIFGGQWKEIRKEVGEFVGKVRSKGTDLTFVMPHCPYDSSTPTCISSGLDYAKSYGTAPSMDFFEVPPAAFYTISMYLMGQGVDVITTISNFHIELAAWAKIKQVDGILSDNNEFLVIGQMPFYLLKSLAPETGCVKGVDVGVLCKALGLRPHQLSLLSFLLGNAVLPVAKLERFHKKLRQGIGNITSNPLLDIMPRLCMYVRPTTTNYHMIVRNVFQSQIDVEFLQSHISKYRLEHVTDTWLPCTPPDDLVYPVQVYEAVFQDQIKCQRYPFICDVLLHRSYTQGLTIEHKGSISTSTFNLYRPIRATCYSIIMRSPTTSVTESCHDVLESVTSPSDSGEDGPYDLEVTLRGKCEKTKWMVFVKCLRVTFSDRLAKELPDQYLGLCVILNYIWHTPLFRLEEFELNAFIAQAVSQYASDVPSLQRILVSVVNVRAVSLAAVFMRGVEAVLQVAAITDLSLPSLLPHHYFDGKLFSFYYYLSQQGSTPDMLCDNMADRMEMFNFLKMIVQSEQLTMDDTTDDNVHQGVVTPITTTPSGDEDMVDGTTRDIATPGSSTTTTDKEQEISTCKPRVTLVDSTYGDGGDSDSEEEQDGDTADAAPLTLPPHILTDGHLPSITTPTEEIQRIALSSSLSIVPEYEEISDNEDNPTKQEYDDVFEEQSEVLLPTPPPTSNEGQDAPLLPKSEALYDALSSDEEVKEPPKRSHQNSEKENQGLLNIKVTVKHLQNGSSADTGLSNGSITSNATGHISKKQKLCEDSQ